MNEPKRLIEAHPPGAPLELQASAMLRAAADVEPWDELAQARMRRSVLAELTHPPRRWLEPRTLLAGALALAAIGAVLVLRHPRRGDLASHLATSTDAQIHLVPAAHPGDDDQLNLMRGLINVSGADPHRGLQVHTPHLTASVHASSYFVEVAGDRTTLFLTEGEAWVGGIRRVHLVSGQSIRSDDPRLAAPLAPAPTPAPTPTANPPQVAMAKEPSDDCATKAAADARYDCYLQLSMGSDQIAQNALFELGVIESDERRDGPSAIVTWGAYLKRFPQGSLAPEARFSILSEYLAERRAPEAIQEASAFVGLYPTDPRCVEVRLASASLACTLDAEANRGLALVAPLLEGATEATRGELLFVAATCHHRLGNSAEARRTDQAYLDEFPSGPHAAEARARSSSN